MVKWPWSYLLPKGLPPIKPRPSKHIYSSSTCAESTLLTKHRSDPDLAMKHTFLKHFCRLVHSVFAFGIPFFTQLNPLRPSRMRPNAFFSTMAPPPIRLRSCVHSLIHSFAHSLLHSFTRVPSQCELERGCRDQPLMKGSRAEVRGISVSRE